jgi:hypothetical protein
MIDVYKWERIVPVAFGRYRDNPPAGTYAPDLDCRGFCNYGGYVVGVCRGDLTRVKVTRVLLDEDAPLFVSSGDPGKLTIVSPSPNPGQLPSGTRVYIDFRASNTDGDVKIRVHAQKLDGPIIGELTVHISQLLTITCAVHRTAIYKPPSTRTAANTTARTFANIDTLMGEVNRIWRPCGIEFFVGSRKDDTNLTNQVPRNGINPSDGALLCPVYGTPGEAGVNVNFTLLMATNKVDGLVNIYFARDIRSATASGNPRYNGFGSAGERGMVVRDRDPIQAQAETVAHELGHILTLAGQGHANSHDSHSDDDPQWSNTVPNRRHDLFSRRRLMYYMGGLEAADRTGPGGRYAFDGINAGYGDGVRGRMITIKNLTQDPTDSEYTDARNRQATLFIP